MKDYFKSLATPFIKNLPKDFNPTENTISNSRDYKTIIIVYKNNQKIFSNITEDLYINLASTVKPFLLELARQLIAENKINDKFCVDCSFIKEIIWRRGYSIINLRPGFLAVKKWLFKQSKIPIFTKYFLLLRRNEIINWKNDIVFELSLLDIAYPVLILSSNKGIEIVKKALVDYFGSEEKIEKELKERKIINTLELTKDKKDIWFQRGANTALVFDLIESFTRLVENKSSIIHISKNNSHFFDIGITNLLKINPKKYDLWEKTGMAMPVVFGSKLSNQNFPPHLLIGTIACLKPHNLNEMFSIAAFNLRTIAVPIELDKNNLPDTSLNLYYEYSQITKLKAINVLSKKIREVFNQLGIQSIEKSMFDANFLFKLEKRFYLFFRYSSKTLLNLIRGKK